MLITGGSYAFWAWQSNPNKGVSFNVASNLRDYIEYDNGYYWYSTEMIK